MDEPTGVLTPQETSELFRVLRGLVEKGKTIIFITHKLREVLALTDTITVLRRGKSKIIDIVSPDASEEQLGILMTGGHIEQ